MKATRKRVAAIALCLFIGLIAEAVVSGDEGGKEDVTSSTSEDKMALDGMELGQLDDAMKKGESYKYETEVDRLMKLIINSLYRKKEIFLRELISNASDALDKIRVLSLTIKSILDANPDLDIRIRVNKDKKTLSISDSGVGMTKQDLIKNLGTIAKSGTAEFLGKMQEVDAQQQTDMIGQFGVGFYSAFLVADRVVVTTKHHQDKQYIWESDSKSFSIVEDPRGDTLKRGTIITLHMKNESLNYLEPETIEQLVKTYSQFINFPIYLWKSKTVKEELNEPEEEEEEEKEDQGTDSQDEEAKVEEEEDDKKKKEKKMVEKTVWDWEKLNEIKPIWTLKPSEISDEKYNEFYNSLSKDSEPLLAHIHFVAEGEVSFKSLLFIPRVQPSDNFNRYGTKADSIKLYVRRVFITDEFIDLMPKYLSFILGIVDSEDLPLNVSRENLQQHKLVKIIKKRLVRKVLDMIKKLSKDDFDKFWKEYSTNIKLGVIEDKQNGARLSKLLKFLSSKKKELVFLADYVERMKPKQTHIYYIAGTSVDEVEKSPFVERLIKKDYEVLFLTEPVDEYAISSLPEFEGKKFQNVAKDGFSLPEDSEKSKDKMEALKKSFQPLTDWLADKLKDHISKAQVSERLTSSPCALVASMFGWTGNMERLALSNAHQKSDDPQKSYYLTQKKTLEINPRHPLIRQLLRRIEYEPNDQTALDMAMLMFNTASLRSGYMLREASTFADRVEALMKQNLGIPADDQDDMDEDGDEYEEEDEPEEAPKDASDETQQREEEEHDEL